MFHARRVVSIAVVAALGLTGLSGCRSDPSVAAYVDGETISHDQVEAMYDDAEAKLVRAVEDFRANQPVDPSASPTASPEPIQMPITRKDIVTMLVGRQLMAGLAEAKGVQPAEVAAEQVEQNVQLPRNSAYVQQYAEFQGYFQALVEDLPPAELTEEDLREVHRRIQRSGGLPDLQGTYEEFVAKLDAQSRDTLARAIAVRDLFYEQVEKVDATVNPRYAPAELPLVQARGADGRPVGLVVLSLSAEGGNMPVVDAG
jgi:hypothetical protein